MQSTIEPLSLGEERARQRFRQTLDEDVRAEFINGEVIVQMTVRDRHSAAVKNLLRLIGTYVELKGLGVVRAEQALTGFVRNDYAPDICFWASAKAAKLDANTLIYPIPDLICEVLSPSTQARDRGIKFEDYAAHSVGEYWIIDPDAKTIEQYIIRDGNYESTGKFRSGEIQSSVISGLSFPVNAAFDDQANLAALRRILA